MNKLFRRDRNTRLRALRLYLVVILACTFLLFCFSIVSLYQERQSASSDRELRVKRAVLDLEISIERYAADCLSRENIEALHIDPSQADSLEHLRILRDRFRILGTSCPVASHFFVFDGQRLVFPRLEMPPRHSLDAMISSTPGRSNGEFAEFFKQGQAQERLGNAAAAAQGYDHAERLEVNGRLKGLAAFRRAEAFRKANDPVAASQAYQHLLKSYGDQYDEFQSPYILSVAAGADAARELVPIDSKSLHTIYDDLVGGKWELSAEQTDRYMTRLEKLLGISPGSRPLSDFVQRFDLGRAIGRELSAGRLLIPFAITPKLIRYGKQSYQIYAAALPGDNGQNLFVGFSLSVPWIADKIIKDLADVGTSATTPLVNINTFGSPNEDVSENNGYIQFPTILQDWRIKLPDEAMHLTEIAASKDAWFVGISIFMFLSIMALVSYLLLRISWDIQWYTLRSDFVSGVSHEFKTPLSLVRLYSETLANDDQEFSAEERRNYIRIIARESERMSRLIDNVLNFSRMEQGQKRHEMQEGDLTETVQQTVDDYSEYLIWRGFDVKSSIQSDLPRVRFSREQLSQIILNLMDNAAKYSGKSREVRVNTWAQDETVIVEVRDKGLGIPPAEKERIFEPFYRASRGGEKGGCGLGLYLVDQVMKEHGGRVEVESEVDRGSRFRLIFPAISSDKNYVGRALKREMTKG